MAVVTIRQLLDSGVHFGHQTRRWNPKMKRFILTERSGSHIIDLQQSLAYIDKTYDYVKETVAHGGTILFVGTKKQAQGAIAEQATARRPALRQPALARWPPHQLPDGLQAPRAHEGARRARLRRHDQAASPRRSCSSRSASSIKLHKSLGGIRNLTKTPSAIWVVDTKKEHLAIDEARKLGIPVIAILDTNCDPDEVQYPIPGNDDAIRSVGLLTRIIADAAAEGLIQRHQKPEEGTSQPSSRSPSGRPSCSGLRAAAEPSSRGRRRPSSAEPRRGRGRVVARAAAEENDADAVAASRGRCRRDRRPSTPSSRRQPRRRSRPRPPRREEASCRRSRSQEADAAYSRQEVRNDHGKLQPRRPQDPARAPRHRHGRHQERARRGRR